MPEEALNKFYVGAWRMCMDLFSTQPHWAKPSLEEAVAHAEQVLEAEPEQDFALVVEVVRVVWQKKMYTIEEYLAERKPPTSLETTLVRKPPTSPTEKTCRAESTVVESHAKWRNA